MTDSHKTVESLSAFGEDQLMAWMDSVFEPEPSGESKEVATFNENRLLDSTELIKIIAGENTVPHLISFWPTTDEQLNGKTFQNGFQQNKFFQYYEHLFTFRNVWNFAMKNMRKYIEEDKLQFNYVNCKSNRDVCEALGFEELTYDRIDPTLLPQVVLYLPKTNGGNAIYYNHKIDNFHNINAAIKSFSNWIYRTLVNSEFEDLEFSDIKNFIGAATNLNGKGGIADVSDFSKVAFIQVNDPDTAVREDLDILPHLLQPVADLDGDVYLFKTTDKAGALKFLEEQAKNMANNYLTLTDDDKKDGFDEELFISRTHSTFPMYICVKASSLYTPVYQSFMSKDVRDYGNILKFIRRNYLPAVNQLTLDTKRKIFPSKFFENINDKSEKVLITLTDFKPKQFFDTEFFMSYIYHKFALFNDKQKFSKILDKRDAKHKKVRKIKAMDGSSDDIIDALREEIVISFISTENHLYPTYVDIKQFPEIVSYLGWTNVDVDKYDVGDVILADRFAGKYWDEDADGQKLNINDPAGCFQLLQKASFNGLRGQKLAKTSLVWRIFQVWIFVLALLAGFRLFKQKWRNRRIKVEKMKGLGILGISPDLEESKFD